MTTVLLIAKEPLPGRAKTRLHPPLSLEQAARVAELCLDATLRTANALPATERVLAWAGGRPPALAAGWRIVPQGEGGLDERLAAAFAACAGPTLLLGMDTPQFRFGHVRAVFDAGSERDADVQRTAWFGPATDGGFWALGLTEPDGALLRGIPMSREDTGTRLVARLRAAELRIRMLPALTDIDTIEDAEEVARAMPGSRLARELAGFVRRAA